MSGVKKNRKRKNYAGKFTVILAVALLINVLLYRLPDTVSGVRLKKVDLFSDIRKNNNNDLRLFTQDDDLSEESQSDNDNPEQAENEDITKNDTILPGHIPTNFYTDVNTAVAIPDSIILPPDPKALTADSQENNKPATTQSSVAESSDSAKTKPQTKAKSETTSASDYLFNKNIEDFTSGRTGLRRFFAALNSINTLGRPVRIGFVGDSFIEGDILVADFRAKMQQRFGGRGVGFVPVTSNVAQYRPTIKQSAEGWRTYSIIKDKSHKYVLSGLLFEPDASVASVDFQTVDMYTRLQEVSSLKFIYAANDKTDITVKSGAEEEIYELPPSDAVTQFELKGTFTKGTLIFKRPQGLKAIGLALEDNRGIIVDNFSLRGNSGIVMSELDAGSCRELQQVRPYDLIVLQYGLNVASESVQDYGWYRKRMLEVIDHIQYCFPGADIMVLGVSDRSYKNGNAYSTMPAVLSLLKAQRQTAKEAEVTFWSIFAAMGGQNSMVKYVKSNWASKDYTHLSFRGGREVADAFYDALLTEKGMYDGEERLVER